MKRMYSCVVSDNYGATYMITSKYNSVEHAFADLESQGYHVISVRQTGDDWYAIDFTPEDWATIRTYKETVGAIDMKSAIMNAISVASDDVIWKEPKWQDLKETIEELHDNNQGKPEVELVTRFLLSLMNVLEKKENDE